MQSIHQDNLHMTHHMTHLTLELQDNLDDNTISQC